MFCSRELVYNMSEAVSYELRAFYNDDLRQGIHGKSGLSCFSPVINIMRHPLWGRNQVNTVHCLQVTADGEYWVSSFTHSTAV